MKLLWKKQVDQPVERVFERFSDLANAADHVSGITNIEFLTDGPVGVGTRFKETRVMFGREATEEMTVTDFQPNQAYTIGCESCGCEYRTEFRFHPHGAGTEVEIEMETRALTLFAKILSPLSRLMAGTVKKCVDQDLEDLKVGLEANASTTAT